MLVHGTGRFDAVVDFSAYTGRSTREATTLLRRKTDLYVHISTDSVYDVADPDIRSTRIIVTIICVRIVLIPTLQLRAFARHSAS